MPRKFALLVTLIVLFSAGGSRAQVFLPDDPIWEDPDRLDMPAPEAHSIGDYYDFWINTFGDPGEHSGPALNVNTVGEVPNSSWYTNRHFRNAMSLAELQTGPNTTDGPSTAGPWRVVAGKSDGKTAGMEIEDKRGDRYLLKFDPPGHIELTSGAELISTKLLYALGYHVPENYVVRFERRRLVPGDDAVVETNDGSAPITDQVIDHLLTDAAQYEDGSYRALASKFLEGEPLGPFFYHGTRPDDGNDIFPHEGRRELRGLRVVAAWLNHTDARGVNSLDMLVEEDGRKFVRHHLIDFGSTFGAAPLGPKERWDGHEYILDGRAILLRALSLGAAGLEWAEIEYPDVEALGRIEAAHFEPEEWRPQYPNAAFLRMDGEDAFWAARQVVNFTDEELRAVVSTAKYSDPAVEQRMVEILRRRRDEIGRTYLGFGGGLDRFKTENGDLTFDDLPAQRGLAAAGQVRSAVWRPFDNASGTFEDAIAQDEFRGTGLNIPASDVPVLSVEIRTDGAGSTLVYLRREGRGRGVVGVERRKESRRMDVDRRER